MARDRHALGYRRVNAKVVSSVQPPCVSCPKQARCAEYEWACNDYIEYIRTGRRPCTLRRPTKAKYQAALDIDIHEETES